MNIDILERLVFSNAIKYPNHISKIDYEHVITSSGIDILRLLRTVQHDSNMINHLVLKGLYLKNVKKYPNLTEHHINDLYHLIDREQVASTEEQAGTLIQTLISDLALNKMKNDARGRLEEAIILLEKGDWKKAMQLAKTIQYEPPESLISTKQLLFMSFDETDGFQSGIPIIDNTCGGFFKGNIMSVTGDTGVMKTMWTLWFIIQVLIKNPKFTALYFEKEMPVRDLARRIVSWLLKRSASSMLKSLDKKESSKLELEEVIENHPEIASVLQRLTLVPNIKFNTVPDMFIYIDRYKPDIWCLDFITQLNFGKKGENFNRDVMEGANELKHIVAETNSFGLIINQMKKGVLTTRADKRPIEDDIEWSGTIKQVSAYHLGLFYPYKYYKDRFKNSGQDFDSNYYYLEFLKNRHDPSGTIVPLLAMPEHAEFLIPNQDKQSEMLKWIGGYIRATG